MIFFRYHHIHHHPHSHTNQCQAPHDPSVLPQPTQEHQPRRSRIPYPAKDNYENTVETEVHQTNDASESTDTSSCMEPSAHQCHNMSTRKTKKRSGDGNFGKPQPGSVRAAAFSHGYPEEDVAGKQHGYHESDHGDKQGGGDGQQCHFLPRLQGVENAAFQNQENSPTKAEPSESEVYFADVSSCCNISVKNDGQDSSLYDEAVDVQKPRLISLQKPVEDLATNNQVNINLL